MDLTDFSALELAQQIKAKQVQVEEVFYAAQNQIRLWEPHLHSFLCLEKAIPPACAAALQEKILAGKCCSPLAGVPFAVKDNLCTEGMITTCASRMLENWRPPYCATAVAHLQNAGMHLLGKTNLDEFAMGCSTQTSFFGSTHNPWNLSHTPGGSSGGSAAAVASGEVPCALGTDTGGSIRQPAAFCGVTGLKPTYGRISRYGLIAFASSMDQIGPIARSAAECAALFAEMAVPDPRDATSVGPPSPKPFQADIRSLQGMRIGLPRSFWGNELSEAVRNAVLQMANLLQQMGASVEELEFPLLSLARPAYYILSSVEASSNLARYDGIRWGHRTASASSLEEQYVRSRTEGFGSEVKERILLGYQMLSGTYYQTHYQKACRVRTQIRAAFDQIFRRYDLLLTPTTPAAAPLLAEQKSTGSLSDSSDLYTIPANLAGLPALSVPCGFTGDGLPIGAQLMGNCFSDELVLHVGCLYQQVTDFHRKRPVLPCNPKSHL